MTTKPEKKAMHIGARIAEMRKIAGIKTARELVQKIDDESVTLAVIQSLESGRKNDLRVSQLMLIADALNVSFDDLLGGVAGLQSAYVEHARQSSEFTRYLQQYARSLLYVAVAADRAESGGRLRDVDTVGWLDTELVNQSPAQMTRAAHMFIQSAIQRDGLDPNGTYTKKLLDAVRRDNEALEKNRIDNTEARRYRAARNASSDSEVVSDG